MVDPGVGSPSIISSGDAASGFPIGGDGSTAVGGSCVVAMVGCGVVVGGVGGGSSTTTGGKGRTGVGRVGEAVGSGKALLTLAGGEERPEPK